ncbi:MAG: ribonuclease P protein component [Candidatus Tectomicrobia bacterium]|uniref:Ribonuclease P protein component n=1 Tax=Tectimicrobiota bacterium TaxID=2528274 RepID=A0A932GQ54_UNCTE|nr:ribonuclease P protein component [Candidatus Tectomicrobia bacterium]
MISIGMEKRADLSWPKKWRLRKSQDFRLVYNLGRRQVCRCIVLVWVPGVERKTRVGLAAARSLGTHVQRNRARRRLREILRRHKERLPGGLDMVFIARPALLEVSFEVACREVLGALAHFSEGKMG